MGKLGRRPIRSRNTFWAKAAAKSLCAMNITPNMISMTSVLFAAMGMTCLIAARQTPHAVFFLLTAVFILCRLLCNLFDGMVAVEGGKQSALGELYNELPDRLSDVLLIAPLGYLCAGRLFAVPLGWIAALLALATAYLRTFSAAQGCTSFVGPMAKSHRMALEVAGLLLAAVFGHAAGLIFYFVILIMTAGCIITLLRRLRILVQFMQNHSLGDLHAK